MNRYLELKNRHQEEVNNFPMVFAFSNKQFEEGMQKLGLKPTETDKIYSMGGGGYYKKTDADKLHKMFETHDNEIKKEIENDTTGEGFIYDMFDYELGNHEYNYTHDITDTINALGLTVKEINNNKNLVKGLNKACKDQEEWYEING